MYNYKIKTTQYSLVFYYRDRKNNKLIFYQSYKQIFKNFVFFHFEIINPNNNNNIFYCYLIFYKYNIKYNKYIYYAKNNSKYSKNINNVGNFMKIYSNHTTAEYKKKHRTKHKFISYINCFIFKEYIYYYKYYLIYKLIIKTQQQYLIIINNKYKCLFNILLLFF